MTKNQNTSRSGATLICFGFLLFVTLATFFLQQKKGYSGYFFSAQSFGLHKHEPNFFIAVLYYFGEFFIGLIGFIPACLFAFCALWQGYCLWMHHFLWFEFLLSMSSLLLMMLYSVNVARQFYSGGIFGDQLYYILLNHVQENTLFFSISFLLMIHIIVLFQFKGIFLIEWLCKRARPIIKKVKHIFIWMMTKTALFLSYCYYMMLQCINNIFYILLPSRVPSVEKKIFAQACQELINVRIRYFNALLLYESIDLKNSKDSSDISLSSKIQLDSKEILFDNDVVQVDVEHANQIKNTARLLEEKLKRCGVLGTVVGIKEGPVVTLFEYKPEGDTKLTKILNLEDDLVMALEALSIRIRAPIPGTALVGFEIANKKRQILRFGSLIASEEYKKNTYALPLILGHDVQGLPAIYDLAVMPHILMAGSTGSGKSVTLHGFIVGLLQACSFQKLKLILIDPKRLELGYYQDIPHLLFPVVHDVSRAVTVLQWVVEEMNRRYELIAQSRVRSMSEYNSCIQEKDMLPFIVVVIDELADLMMTGGRDIEDKIVRLAQMARASGIHLIVATQRPSVDVVTGLIKVNFTSRIALRVTSRIDSRTIIDTPGAHKLLGKGDMLFLDGSSGQLCRLHAALLTTAEIERVVSALKKLSSPQYLTFVDCSLVQTNSLLQEDIELYAEVKKFLNEIDEVSISLLQRKFRIGYNRAARIIEAFQEEGIILPPDGSKVRKIIR